MSKRSKNRPKRIGPPAEKPKPIIIRPCAICHVSSDVSKMSLFVTIQGMDKICAKCRYGRED